MAGYSGKAMSRNAVIAYAYGEKPISKWTKKAILEEVALYEEEHGCNFPQIRKLTLAELKEELLSNSSWHHTSTLYNCTDFYAIDTRGIERLTPERVNKIITERTEKSGCVKNRNKNALELAKDLYEKIIIIFESGVTGLKTASGIRRKIDSGKLDLDETYKKALDVLCEKEQKKVNAWMRLPVDHCRHKSVVEFENNKEAYIRKNYASDYSPNCKMVQEFKQIFLNQEI